MYLVFTKASTSKVCLIGTRSSEVSMALKQDEFFSWEEIAGNRKRTWKVWLFSAQSLRREKTLYIDLYTIDV